MTPAIEQAVKALDRAVMLIETAWMDEEPLPCEQTGVDEVKKVAASLRALTEPKPEYYCRGEDIYNSRHQIIARTVTYHGIYCGVERAKQIVKLLNGEKQ